MARRAENVWYVGGLNADAAQITRVDLSFLPAGSVRMTLIRDGAEDRAFNSSTNTVTSKDIVAIAMRARGGFVMRIE